MPSIVGMASLFGVVVNDSIAQGAKPIVQHCFLKGVDEKTARDVIIRLPCTRMFLRNRLNLPTPHAIPFPGGLKRFAGISQDSTFNGCRRLAVGPPVR